MTTANTNHDCQDSLSSGYETLRLVAYLLDMFSRNRQSLRIIMEREGCCSDDEKRAIQGLKMEVDSLLQGSSSWSSCSQSLDRDSDEKEMMASEVGGR